MTSDEATAIVRRYLIAQHCTRHPVVLERRRKLSRPVTAIIAMLGSESPDDPPMSPMGGISGVTLNANGNQVDAGVYAARGSASGLNDVVVVGARAGVLVDRDAYVASTGLDVRNNGTGVDNAGIFHGPDTEF
jgi:hypothetical protein